MANPFKDIEPNDKPSDELKNKVLGSRSFIDKWLQMVELFVGNMFGTIAKGAQDKEPTEPKKGDEDDRSKKNLKPLN